MFDAQAAFVVGSEATLPPTPFGVAGIAAAIRCCDESRDSPRNNYHLFQPLNYHVATGSLSPGEIAVPLRKIFRRKRRVRVLMGEVGARRSAEACAR
jgi:hypothetical protein